MTIPKGPKRNSNAGVLNLRGINEKTIRTFKAFCAKHGLHMYREVERLMAAATKSSTPKPEEHKEGETL